MGTLSQRNGRHVSPAQAGGALQNPAYRLADIYVNEGFGVTRRTPRHFLPDSVGVPNSVPTAVPTFQSDPFDSRTSLNRLAGSRGMRLNRCQYFRPAQLAPKETPLLCGPLPRDASAPLVSGDRPGRRSPPSSLHCGVRDRAASRITSATQWSHLDSEEDQNHV